MPEAAISEYFYGDEAEQFIYFRIPRQLITDPRFKHLSTDAKLLYGMLLDRMSLSVKNGWYDEDGRVYIYYTVEEICGDMNCGRDKAMKMLADLDTKKGVGLIRRVSQGQGKPTRLYVKRFTTGAVPSQPAPPEPPPFTPFSGVDFSGVQKSISPTSASRESRRAGVEKTDPNYTNQNQTDFSYYNEIYGAPELSAKAKQVLVYLRDRANKDGESWYAIGTMARDLSLSRSTIKRALAELIRQGRVEKRVRFRENGGCTSNWYQLR